jgi:hypothetical protein
MFHLVYKQLLLLLSAFTLSDIPGNFGSADNPSIGILERRYRQEMSIRLPSLRRRTVS